MYFPLITEPSDKYDRRLYRRKGGGGEGGGGGGGGRSGSSGGKSTGGISPGKSTSTISTGGTSRSAIAYGAGGGPALTIPAGQLFAGRSAGGGLRSQIYGTPLVLLLLIFVLYFD